MQNYAVTLKGTLITIIVMKLLQKLKGKLFLGFRLLVYKCLEMGVAEFFLKKKMQATINRYHQAVYTAVSEKKNLHNSKVFGDSMKMRRWIFKF